MLSVENIDLYYGAAHALRDVSLTPQPARSPACWAATASARPHCCARSSASSRSARGTIRWDGTGYHRGCRPTTGRARGIACVPQGREIFPR